MHISDEKEKPAPQERYTSVGSDSTALRDENPLHIFIEKHVLEGAPIVVPSRSANILKNALYITGATFGLPWINAAFDLSKHLPVSLRDIFGYYFVIGTIIGLGGDLIWMISSISTQFTKKVPTVTATYHYSQGKNRTTLVSLSFSFAASLPWIYASIVFNSGIVRYLAPLSVFPNNLVFGFIGYDALLKRGLKLKRYYELSAEKREAEDVRDILIGRIRQVICHNIVIPNNIKTAANLIEYLLDLPVSEPPYRIARHVFQGIFTAAIPLLYVVTEGLLAKKLVTDNILNNNALGYGIATILVIPGLVLSLISTFDISAQLFDSLICEKNIGSVQSELYPRLSWFISFCMILIAFAAPSAGNEVAYQTIQEETQNSTFTWVCTIGMMLFHFILFKFTSRELTTDVMVAVKSTPSSKVVPVSSDAPQPEPVEAQDKTTRPTRIARQYKRLSQFTTVLENADSIFLSHAVLWHKNKKPPASKYLSITLDDLSDETPGLTKGIA